MAVANYFKIMILLLIPAFAAGLVTLIYMPAYRKKINARLGDFDPLDHKAQKPVTSPVLFFLISFAVAFLAFVLVLMIMFNGLRFTGGSKKTVTLGEVNRPEFLMQARDIPSLLDKFEPGEELPGYEIKETVRENDIEIYFYANREVEYSGFPDGLIGVRYTGSDEQYLGLTVKMEQDMDTIGGDYSGSYEFRTYDVPLKWFTFDIFMFFGKLDLNVFTMNKSSFLDQPLEDLLTGKEAKMHLELDKEYGIEGWHKETDKN